jgi:transposase
MILTPGRNAAERGRHWAKIINKARLYPAGITAYCKDTNVAKNSYYSWFKKLRARHPEWEDLNGQDGSAEKPASDSTTKKRPDIEVKEPTQRRQFTTSYKAKILDELESAEGGQVASILRREGLYASHISKWRYERRLAAKEESKRGPKSNPLTSENNQLKAEVQQLKKRLHRATALLDLQKKVSEILGVNLQQTIDDE